MIKPPPVEGMEFLECLGGSPMTVVHAARCLETEQKVAVKSLRPGWEDESTALLLIRREARACYAVEHANVIHLLEAYVARSPFYLVFEYLPGVSLRDRLDELGRYEYLAEPIAIMREIALGLAALHRGGFVHGDIKPENIRLLPDGRVKVIDLGFAHRPGENLSLWNDGYILGTANYLAPEMCRMDSGADYRSDLFSLGVMFFEMLTGQLPYESGDVRETMHRHLYERPIVIESLRPDLSGSLMSIIDSLMTPEMGKRMSGASLLVQRLMMAQQPIDGLRRSA